MTSVCMAITSTAAVYLCVDAVFIFSVFMLFGVKFVFAHFFGVVSRILFMLLLCFYCWFWYGMCCVWFVLHLIIRRCCNACIRWNHWRYLSYFLVYFSVACLFYCCFWYCCVVASSLCCFLYFSVLLPSSFIGVFWYCCVAVFYISLCCYHHFLFASFDTVAL